ncbi:MAG TPA: hypothetical protein VFS15_02850, partial [Kofleriaceae bacterium]|nr:hypothetical protein [Kofleriaceae bacterium]
MGRFTVAALALVLCDGCDGEDCCTIDAAPPPQDAPMLVDGPSSTNTGFVPPNAVIAAWSSPTADTYQPEVVDLGCLGAPRNDPATTMTVTLTAHLRDFQSGNVLSGATVTAFDGATFTTPFSAGTSDSSGTATLSIPPGKQRIGFSSVATSTIRTITLDRLLEPATANQTVDLMSVSDATAATLPALIGQTRTPGTALVLGRAHDCQGHLLSELIATVSSVPGMPVH